MKVECFKTLALAERANGYPYIASVELRKGEHVQADGDDAAQAKKKLIINLKRKVQYLLDEVNLYEEAISQVNKKI